MGVSPIRAASIGRTESRGIPAGNPPVSRFVNPAKLRIPSNSPGVSFCGSGFPRFHDSMNGFDLRPPISRGNYVKWQKKGLLWNVKNLDFFGQNGCKRGTNRNTGQNSIEFLGGNSLHRHPIDCQFSRGFQREFHQNELGSFMDSFGNGFLHCVPQNSLGSMSFREFFDVSIDGTQFHSAVFPYFDSKVR